MIGIENNFNKDIATEIQQGKEANADFIITPLFHPRNIQRNQELDNIRVFPSTRSDMLLSHKEWTSTIVGKISTWIDLDNHDLKIQQDSEYVLQQEFNWAVHIGIQAILFPPPLSSSSTHHHGGGCSNYARILRNFCDSLQYQQILLTIPIMIPMTYKSMTPTTTTITSTHANSTNDGWHVWNAMRFLANHHHRLYIVLEFNLDHDDMNDINFTNTNNSDTTSAISTLQTELLSRWKGEPIKAIILSSKIFIKNKGGYPVLNKTWQAIIKVFIELNVAIIIKGKPYIFPTPSNASATTNIGLKYYIEYLRHLRSNYLNSLSEQERMLISYRDTLQTPLQPLMDNLESSTYETFERDSPKYTHYQTAIGRAYHVLQQQGHITSTAVVLVVGAGRGPLVTCALEAATAANIQVRIYAVEKNANAVITLRNRILSDNWGEKVTVVSCDMRDWKAPELADIIVSELLGSWGDNELSPECLDSVQQYLKPRGVMIPSKYTSYIAPVTASRVWMGARDMPLITGLDSAYVVKLHACDYLSISQPLFTFIHPSIPSYNLSTPSITIDHQQHRRYHQISFTIDKDCTMHGISGTFHSILYEDICISTVPEIHTYDMHSWFPLFIPLSVPIALSKGNIVTIAVWRCCNTKKVWYEWCLISPISTPIQNSGGKTYWIGL